MLQIGQRVRLLTTSRAKLLWDRAGYSAQVEAGTEGVVCGPELLGRDGYLTTEAIQELRGYPGTPAWEVAFLVAQSGVRSDPWEDAWVYVTPDCLAEVDIHANRPLPHTAEVERRLCQMAREATR